jgi:hypothetical protein
MQDDLERRGIAYPDAREPRMFTYRKEDPPVEAAAFLCESVIAAVSALP